MNIQIESHPKKIFKNIQLSQMGHCHPALQMHTNTEIPTNTEISTNTETPTNIEIPTNTEI